MADRNEMPDEVHCYGDGEVHAQAANTGQTVESAAGHETCADEGCLTASRPLSDATAQIRYWHRQRVYAMEQRKRADLALGSFLRTALGWSKALPDVERKIIAEQAKALVGIGEKEAKGKPSDINEPAYDEWRDVILASLSARLPFDTIEKRAEKEMKASGS